MALQDNIDQYVNSMYMALAPVSYFELQILALGQVSAPTARLQGSSWEVKRATQVMTWLSTPLFLRASFR